MAWFSKDGRDWSAPVNIGEPNNWLWRVTWHKGAAYGVGYATGREVLPVEPRVLMEGEVARIVLPGDPDY